MSDEMDRTRALSLPVMELLGALGIDAIIFYGGCNVIRGHSSSPAAALWVTPGETGWDRLFGQRKWKVRIMVFHSILFERIEDSIKAERAE